MSNFIREDSKIKKIISRENNEIKKIINRAMFKDNDTVEKIEKIDNFFSDLKIDYKNY